MISSSHTLWFKKRDETLQVWELQCKLSRKTIYKQIPIKTEKGNLFNHLRRAAVPYDFSQISFTVTSEISFLHRIVLLEAIIYQLVLIKIIKDEVLYRKQLSRVRNIKASVCLMG